MMRRPTIISTAIALALIAMTGPAAASADAVQYQSGQYNCGTKYLRGFTTGYTNIWVNSAGGYDSASISYPGGSVYATGGHVGTVTSYASSTINSWGKSSCTLP